MYWGRTTIEKKGTKKYNNHNRPTYLSNDNWNGQPPPPTPFNICLKPCQVSLPNARESLYASYFSLPSKTHARVTSYFSRCQHVFTWLSSLNYEVRFILSSSIFTPANYCTSFHLNTCDPLFSFFPKSPTTDPNTL